MTAQLTRKIAAVQARLNRNARLRDVLFAGAALLYIAAALALLWPMLGYRSLAVVVLGLAALFFPARRARLLARSTRRDACLFIDQRFQTKERVVSFAELAEYGAEPARIDDLKREYLERQLAPLFARLDPRQLLPFRLSAAARYYLAGAPLCCLAVFAYAWLFSIYAPLNPDEMKAIEQLLAAQLPPPLEVKLEELAEALRDHELESQEVLAALVRAEAELDAARSENSSGRDAARDFASERQKEQRAKEPERGSPAERKTPTPTPTPKAQEREQPPPPDQHQPADEPDEGAKEQSAGGEAGQEGEQQQQGKTGKGQEQESDRGQGQGQGADGQDQGQEQGDKNSRSGSGQGKDGQGKEQGQDEGQQPGSGAQGDGEGQNEQGQEKSSQAKDAGGKEGDQGAAQQQGGGERQGSQGGENGLSQVGQALGELRDQIEQQQGEQGRQPGENQQSPGEKQGQQGQNPGSRGRQDGKQQDRRQDSEDQSSKGKDDSARNVGTSSNQESSSRAEPESDRNQDPNQEATGSSMAENDLPTREMSDEDGFSRNSAEGKTSFHNEEVQGKEEHFDERYGTNEGRVTRQSPGAGAKTDIADVKLAQPETVKDQGEQPIPLEYRDILR